MELYHYILILGAIFVVTVHIGYFGILNNQFKLYQKKTHRLQILSTRLALFLPTCSIIIYLQIAVAELNIALQIPLAIAEALAFYTFLSYVQNIFGSPNATLLAIDHELPRPNPGPIIAFFMKFYSRDATILYRRLMVSLYHVLITRPIVIIFQVVCGYLIEDPNAKAANTVFAIASMAIMMNGFITLLVFYERAHPGCNGTNALTKLAIFKLAILLPVFQDFIIRLLINHAKQRKGVTTTEVRIHQLNDIVLLGEMMFLAFPMYFIFSAQIHNRFQTYMLTTGGTGIKKDNNNNTSNSDNSNNIIRGESSGYGYPMTKQYSSRQGGSGNGSARFLSLFEWDSVAIGIQKNPEDEIKWKYFVREVFHIADMRGTFVNELVIESTDDEEEEMKNKINKGKLTGKANNNSYNNKNNNNNSSNDDRNDNNQVYNNSIRNDDDDSYDNNNNDGSSSGYNNINNNNNQNNDHHNDRGRNSSSTNAYESNNNNDDDGIIDDDRDSGNNDDAYST